MRTETPFNRKERKDRKERPSLLLSKQNLLFAFFAFFAVAHGLVTGTAFCAEEAADPSVRLYDTGLAAAGALTEQDLTAKAGWTRVPENDLSHLFKGAAVLMNDRVAGMLWLGGPGADLCSNTGNRWKHRALIWPLHARGDATVSLLSVRLIENTPGAVAVQGVFKTAGGGTVSLTYRLTSGQPFVELRPGEGPGNLWICCRTSYVVVPDFFGDDMVFGTGSLDAARLPLPAESCLLNLLPNRDGIVVCAWQPRNLKVLAGVSVVKSRGTESPRFLGVTEILGVPDARIWVAFLEGQDLWHERPVKFADEGTTVALDWKPPFAAKWRADLVHGDGFAESMPFESPPALAPGRYVIYPLDRTKATPLTEFTPVDILRNTLGVGPCQYILETEGLASADNPTPDSCLTWVEKQLKKKGGKDAADEIRERLKAMVELVGRTEARIKRYADFAAEMKQLLASDNSETGLKLKATIDAIAQAAAAGLAATEPPGRVAKLADAVAGLIGKDTAAADLAAPAAELRAVGAAQDRALAKGRMAVRWLGCQGRTSELAKRTDAFLQGK